METFKNVAFHDSILQFSSTLSTFSHHSDLQKFSSPLNVFILQHLSAALSHPFLTSLSVTCLVYMQPLDCIKSMLSKNSTALLSINSYYQS